MDGMRSPRNPPPRPAFRIAGAVLLALLLGTHSGTAADNEDSAHFYFVQVTDTHFGSRNHNDTTSRIVDHINRLPFEITCVIHTGDICADNIRNPAVPAAATSILARIKAPLHLVPGNHDILQDHLPETLAIYTNAFGPLCQEIEYHGVVFILIYTEPLRSSFSVPGYAPLQWLESALARAGDKPVLIFHHAPSVEDFYDNTVHRGWRQDARAHWRRLIRSGNVRAIVSAHFHRDELHWLEDVPLYVSAPVAGYWGRQPSFRVYEYRKGKLSYRTVYVE